MQYKYGIGPLPTWLQYINQAPFAFHQDSLLASLSFFYIFLNEATPGLPLNSAHCNHAESAVKGIAEGGGRGEWGTSRGEVSIYVCCVRFFAEFAAAAAHSVQCQKKPI